MDFFHACTNAAHEIGELLATTSHSTLCAKRSVGFGGDTTREIDSLCESILFSHLSPFGAVLSEESGVMGEGEITFIVDPLDGSDNFVSQIPYYGFSVARKHEGKTVAGFVMNLATQHFIYRGEGDAVEGKLGEEHIRLVPNPYATVGIFEKGYAHASLGNALFMEGEKYRVMGALALSLAWAHHIPFLIFKGEARVFDIAAALHIIEGLEVKHQDDLLLVAHTKERLESLETILTKGRR